MSASGREDRERLKEEYKEHYRKIRDAKEKLRQTSYAKKASDAVKQMQADELLDSIDHFLGKLRHKMASMEARLDQAMDDIITSGKEEQEEMDEELRKENAKDTIRQIKLEMGMLYDDLEKQAEEMKVQKTVGTSRQSDTSPDNEKSGHS